ncbi:MAG: STAS domain-containing protein [Candidatus Thiodiazotropha endolucinida]
MSSYSLTKSLSLNQVEALIGDSTPSADGERVTIDMTDVEWIDVGALLLLLVWIRMLKNERRDINLRLPNFNSQRKARDFLKKWNFERALQEALKTDIANVLEPDQISYFEAPLEFYTDSKISEEYGPLKILKSRNLLEIVPLTSLSDDGNEFVSKEKINQIADSLALESVVPIIQSSIQCSREWAERFGSVLIYQALLNTFEHPNANMGFLSIAKKPNPPGIAGGRLVIAVADNGETISSTIADAYSIDERARTHLQKIDSKDDSDSYKLHSNRVVYATWKETSRKPPEENPQRGMGLFYLRNLTSEVGGEVIIRCENSSVKFRSKHNPIEGKPDNSPRQVPHLSRGNIIRISIPLCH